MADHEGLEHQGGVGRWPVIASEAKQSRAKQEVWIASRSLSSGGAFAPTGWLAMTTLATTDYSRILSSFCKQRTPRTSGGIGVSGKLDFQLVTPTSPT